jgi:hypothetical protein
MTTPTFPIAIDKTVTAITATSGVFTLTLDDVNGIQVGSRVDIGGLPTAAWNTFSEEVTAVNATTKTIQYTHGNFTVAAADVWGQVHLETTWATSADVELWLGFDATGTDQTFLDLCTDAANDRCWYYRARAGYQDHPNVAPGTDARTAVIMYAAQLFRQRGAVDSYASFQEQGFGAIPGQTLGVILALLGCKRPQVG